MAGVIDAFVAYKFIRGLSTPWKEWDAYKLGLIDEKGKSIKKPKSTDEKKALPMWKTLIRNIKRFLEKLPFGSTKLASFASALWLIKEEMGIDDIQVLEKEFVQYLTKNDYIIETDLLIEEKVETGRYIYENNIIYIDESIKPIGVCFGQNIYKVNDITEKHTVIFTSNNLREI